MLLCRSARGRCPLDSRRAPPCTRWGFRPRPQAANAAFFRCGGDGGFWVHSQPSLHSARPAKRQAGRAVRFSAILFYKFQRSLFEYKFFYPYYDLLGLHTRFFVAACFEPVACLLKLSENLTFFSFVENCSLFILKIGV